MTNAVISFFQRPFADSNKAAPTDFLWIALVAALFIAVGIWREWKRRNPGR